MPLLLSRWQILFVVQLLVVFETPWTVAHQAPLSMGLSRQEYWSGSLCPSPGDLPNPGIEPVSPAWQADSLPLNHLGTSEINLIVMKVAQLCPTLCDPIDEPVSLLCPWNSPGKNIRVGSNSLLQGIFPIQESNSGLPQCRRILYCMSHQESP